MFARLSPMSAGLRADARSKAKSKTSCVFTSTKRSRCTWPGGVSPVEAETDGAARSWWSDTGHSGRARGPYDLPRLTLARCSSGRPFAAADAGLYKRGPGRTTLNIGATTAIFSVVDAVILRGLPFPQSDRLVAVGELNVKDSAPSALNLTTPQTFLDWRDQQDVFTGIAAIAYAEISLRREGNALPENLRAQRLSSDFFGVLRTQPILGRPFSREDEGEGHGNVAVISYTLWQRRFAGRPDVIGASLPGQQASFEIVGVMPPGFSYPVDTYVLGIREPTDCADCTCSAARSVRGNRYGYNLHVVGRLRDGVSIERAQARMNQITAGLAAETPRWFRIVPRGLSYCTSS